MLFEGLRSLYLTESQKPSTTLVWFHGDKSHHPHNLDLQPNMRQKLVLVLSKTLLVSFLQNYQKPPTLYGR